MRLFFIALLGLVIASSCDDNSSNNVLTPEDIAEFNNYTEPALPVVDSSQLVNMGGDTVANIDNNFPNPNGWVNDYDMLFTQAERDTLTMRIEDHFQQSGDEIYIVTIDDFSPYANVSDYTVALGNAWKTSQDTSINNILIVLAIDQAEVRIESADAAGSRFSDEKSDDIIFLTMMPRFQIGAYYEGIYSAVIETIAYLQASGSN